LSVLRLHYHPASTYARRVRIALLEKDIPHELVALDMRARKHRGPEYLALNPYGRVPTLEEDGHVLYESAAILQYLEATRPTPALVPSDVRGRSLVDMHLRLCDLQMAQPAGTILFPKRFLPRERWDQAAMDTAKRTLEKHIAILEGQLGKNEYLVANRFSLAEVAYAPFLHFLSLLEVVAPPAVAAWSERILARPSAQQTIPPE
jgi:glutathione S-transferase